MARKKYLSLLLILFTQLAFADMERAIFAGGCFWCVESDFAKVPGVKKVVVGFDGGREPINPTYKLVSSGQTNYVESAEITYDSSKVSYKQLVKYFYRHIDPTAKNSQFCDHGSQYRSVIFYLNAQQQADAEAVTKEVKKLFPVVFTEIISSTNFYPAEDYHQQYYLKNKYRYKFYRYTCGRDKRIEEIWHAKKLP